jgi:hypothetical protein
MTNNKLKQTNKCFKCPNCKNTYLEKLEGAYFNGYVTQKYIYLKCNKCFGEFEYVQ